MSRVSIIVPAFNHGRFLAQAVGSALAQAAVDLEVVIVDDGSSDDTPAVCEQLTRDPRVRAIRQPNAGVAAARNRGISESTGEHLTFLDADDLLHPEKSVRQSTLLDGHPDVGFVYCDIVSVDESGAPNGDHYSVGESRRVLHGDILDSLLLGGYFPPHTAMVRRAVLDRVGQFDEALGGHADLDLWMRIAAAGFRAEYLDEKLAYYRSVAGAMSRDVEHMRMTRDLTLAKLARAHPERAASGIAQLQQLNQDLHAANRWLNGRIDRPAAVFDPETAPCGPGLPAIAAAGVCAGVRVEQWDATIDGVTDRTLMLHPPNALEFVIPGAEPGRLIGSVALHPDVWDRDGSGACRFSLTADDRVQWSAVVDPRQRPLDRSWIPFALDVPASADAAHRIRLETAGVGGHAYRWALWRGLQFVQTSFSSQKLQPQGGWTSV